MRRWQIHYESKRGRAAGALAALALCSGVACRVPVDFRAGPKPLALVGDGVRVTFEPRRDVRGLDRAHRSVVLRDVGVAVGIVDDVRGDTLVLTILSAGSDAGRSTTRVQSPVVATVVIESALQVTRVNRNPPPRELWAYAGVVAGVALAIAIWLMQMGEALATRGS